MAQLLDGNSSESESDGFQVNNNYAENYNKWRGKEELQKLKDRYGDSEVNNLESSSSSEDEDLSQVVDKQFLETLSLLKSNDPRIYDAKEVFFPPQEISKPKEAKTKKKKKKGKPLFISDYNRNVILEKQGVYSDEETDEKCEPPSTLTYHQEQKIIKDSFKTALSESEEEGDILSKRVRTKPQEDEDEDDYLHWLKGQEPGSKDQDKVLEKLRAHWKNPSLESGEAYLRDYLLNKKFLKPMQDDIPTYQEVVEDLSEDENELEKQENFEHKYNFRFEEPDPEFIKSYPRTMEDSLRRKDEKRKRNRELLKTKKEQEKESRKEELKRLKALKRAEIMEKLEVLKQVTGGEAFKEEDMEEDFDPQLHDQRMKAIFNEEFYTENADEVQKPEFSADEELDGEDWDNWEENKTADCEDPDFNMDAECEEKPAVQSLKREMLDANRSKKGRRRSKFAQALLKKKPAFDPVQRTFEDYLDEYYKLDYEDMIGDQPVRFPYRTVIPNDFGLSTEEILFAKDKELNRWCSVKKACQYRTEEEERYDVQAFEKKAHNEKLKHKVLTSLFQEAKGSEAKEKPNKKRKRKSCNSQPEDEEVGVNDERLKAFGINPKKHKNKLKYGKKS